MSFTMKFLDGGIVAVLVRDEKGALDGAAVRVVAAVLEDFFVDFDVVVVDGIVEGDGHHLGDGVRLQFARDLGSIGGTETIWQDALTLVAGWSPVRILVDG